VELNALLFTWWTGLGLLATTAMAQQLSGGDYTTANFAIAGVFIARLLPAVFLGPIAGVIAAQIRSPQVDGELRHPADRAVYLDSNSKQLFLALHRNDLGGMHNSILVAGKRSICSKLSSAR
jgi:pheromone shutdown protein TraB